MVGAVTLMTDRGTLMVPAAQSPTTDLIAGGAVTRATLRHRASWESEFKPDCYLVIR